ncbi:transposase, putative (plasmid) [Pseudomonas putida]|nr:transposase, putative [Pseudomonas putida]
MGTLERINAPRHLAVVDDEGVRWEINDQRSTLKKLPQIVWSDNTPWREANLWAFERACDKRCKLKTVLSVMSHLHAYAKWLEAEALPWWHFPARQSDRCLVRFRGHLMAEIDSGNLANSTAKQRMSAVIRFYRWLVAAGLLSPEWPMWNEKSIGIRLVEDFGLERTMRVASTDLAIQNRKKIGDPLEDGLMPVPRDHVGKILEYASQNASLEFYLMLRIGFATGMRFGTIADLKIETIYNAIEDHRFRGFYTIRVGSAARPSVHTKFDVTGDIWIHADDLELLRDYIYSHRRLMRQRLSSMANNNHIFLTKFGVPFGNDDDSYSRAMTVELGRLRKKAATEGFEYLRGFKFHQARCTYATELARTLLRHGNAGMAVEIVKTALLHKDEATTLKYIKFIEKTNVMAKAANEFSTDFLGLASCELYSCTAL